MVASKTRQDCHADDHICWSPKFCDHIKRCQKDKASKPVSAEEATDFATRKGGQ